MLKDIGTYYNDKLYDFYLTIVSFTGNINRTKSNIFIFPILNVIKNKNLVFQLSAAKYQTRKHQKDAATQIFVVFILQVRNITHLRSAGHV